MEVASSRPDHLQTLSIAKTSELSLLAKSPLVAELSMPAMLLRLLLQCSGDIEMNPGPVLTPTPTNCLRLMQWNANGISGKITELLTFLHSNNVNIAVIQESKLTNKTKPLKTPGWAVVRLDRQQEQWWRPANSNQRHDHRRRQHGRSSSVSRSSSGATRHFYHNVQIANNFTSTTSTFRHVAVAALVTTHRSRTSSTTTKCRLSLGILMRITPDEIRTQTKTKEANNVLMKSMLPTTPFLTRMKQRGYRQMAGQLRPTSAWPPMTSHYYQTGQSLSYWPTIICPS